MSQQLGILDMPAETYHRHADSLSSTGARQIVNDCPATFRYLQENPQNKREFDIGTAAHLLVLEPEQFGEGAVLVDAPDYKTKAAQEARDAAWSAGKTPLTIKDADLVRAMRDALHAHPIASKAFVGGQAEKSLFWRDPEFGVICRTRPDYLPPHTRYLVDLKTSASADPADFARSAADLGYYMQASWYLDGLEHITGTRPERFAFVVVSKKPPHLVTVHWVDAEALAWGAIQNRYARGVFAWCMERDEWPGYVQQIGKPGEAFNLKLPVWKLKELEARHAEGGFEPPVIDSMKVAAE